MHIERTKIVSASRALIRATPTKNFGLRFKPNSNEMEETVSYSSFAVNGNYVQADQIVEVSVPEAIDLVNRKFAVYATQAEVDAAGENIIVAPHREGRESWKDA